MAVMDALVLKLILAACLYSQTIQLDSVFAKKAGLYEKENKLPSKWGKSFYHLFNSTGL